MNIKPLLLSAVFAFSAQMIPMSANAEILSIGPHAKVLKKSNLPTRGQSMKQVKKSFGAAQRVKVSKGKVTKRNPKITRWDYSGFSVYFENSHVIHSVVKH